MTTTKKYSLPREFAVKWVAALRSGKYEQGAGWLGNNECGYCCLGLAGILCGASDDMYLTPSRKHHVQFLVDGELVNAYPSQIPDNILQKIPEQLRGTRVGNELVFTLSEMNDDGKTFPQIADWIEQNVAFV